MEPERVPKDAEGSAYRLWKFRHALKTEVRAELQRALPEVRHDFGASRSEQARAFGIHTSA